MRVLGLCVALCLFAVPSLACESSDGGSSGGLVCPGGRWERVSTFQGVAQCQCTTNLNVFPCSEVDSFSKTTGFESCLR